MRHHRILGLFLLGFSAALVRCSSDDFSPSQADAGAEAAVPDAVADGIGTNDTGPADVAVDAPRDAEAAPPPKCDPKKPFGTPTKVLLNALDVVIDPFGAFRINASETVGFVQASNVVRQYDMSGSTLTLVSSVPAVTVPLGFGVSRDGLQMMVSSGTSTLVRYARGNTGAAWGPSAPVGVPLSTPDGAAYQELYYPSIVGNDPTFYLSRFVFYPSLPSTWDIFRAVPGDASTVVVSSVDELHAGAFAFTNQAVPADDLTMYFARWGGAAVAYPRIVKTTRASSQAAWDAPTDVALGSLVIGTADSLYPYAATADDCALYFGFSMATDATYSVNGPFVLYVARRPL
jgi:hypothetical protein